MSVRPKPVVLAILDGWGHSDSPEHNAIMAARTPNWDALIAHYPNGRINASELHVGLPEGQMGNSEVGHMNIGSGRVIMQELPRIDAAIADGSLARNATLKKIIKKLSKAGLFKHKKGACHIMGLLSAGGGAFPPAAYCGTSADHCGIRYCRLDPRIYGWPRCTT